MFYVQTTRGIPSYFMAANVAVKMWLGRSRHRLLVWLRQFGGIYSAARFCWRAGNRGIFAGLRRFSPPFVRWGPSKGYFSEYQRLQEGEVEGEVVMEGQERPVLEGDSLRKLCGLRQDEHQPWAIFWTHRREARLVGKTLIVQEPGKRAALEAVYMEHCVARDPAFRYLHLPPARRLEGQWTSVLSQWSRGFYHWFLDVLPRLALLDRFPPETGVIVPADLQPYEVETLNWLGLAGRTRPTSETHLVVEDFYFSSPTSMTGCYNPYAIEYLRGAFLAFRDRTYESSRRVYVRRAGVSRGVVNEEELARFFEALGWAVVDTAALPLARQIQLFAEADAVCAVHGAALTHLVWCRPGCRVIELCPRNYLNGIYEGIAEHLRLDYRYLVFEADSALRAKVEVGRVREAIEAAALS